MANLLSTTEITNITGAFGDVFDTFKREIVIYKTPQQTAVDVSTSFLYGYDDYSSKPTNYTLTPVSGVFSGVFYGSSYQADVLLGETKTYIPDNQYYIKVERDCRNYINNGRNQRIDVDSKPYKLIGSEKQVNFLTAKYYVFLLEDDI